MHHRRPVLCSRSTEDFLFPSNGMFINSLMHSKQREFLSSKYFVVCYSRQKYSLMLESATMKIRRKLVRVNFRKDLWDCYKVQDQYLIGAPALTIPETIAGLISAPVSSSVFKMANRPYSRHPPSLQALKDWWESSDVTWFLRGQTKHEICQCKKPFRLQNPSRF